MNNNTLLKGLERMGYKGRMTGHGFRGLASTILHEREFWVSNTKPRQRSAIVTESPRGYQKMSSCDRNCAKSFRTF
jgi:hypothetical protein